MNIDYTPTINFNNFDAVDESRIEEQTITLHNTFNLNSAEISAIEHEIIFSKNRNKNERPITSIDKSQFNLIDAKYLQNEDYFLKFTTTKEFKEILNDVTNDINSLTELAVPYITDKNKFKDDMSGLIAKLTDINNYQQNEISTLIKFFRLTRKQLKTIIQLLNLITEYNADKTQKLASADDLTIILSTTIEDNMGLCLSRVITRIFKFYCELKKLLQKSELITETTTNIVSALAQEIRRNEITTGDKLFDEYMDMQDKDSLIKTIANDFAIACPYDLFATDITDSLIIKQFKNKAEIAASPYNILQTVADEISDRLTNIIASHKCLEIFNEGIAINEMPNGLTTDIDNFFIRNLNTILLSANNTVINIDDILEVDDSGTIIRITDLTAKLRFLIPQKLLGKKANWLVGEISNQHYLAAIEQVIVAIGNSYFGVLDKNNLYTKNNEINITFHNNTPVQLKHITSDFITKNNLQQTSYRPLVIEALKNTEHAIEIINFFKNEEINNILREDLEFSEYLAKFISNKAKKNFTLKENLAELICNEIIAENKNILADNSSYNIFINSTLLEPILHKLLEQQIDITDIIAQLTISQIANLSQQDSLKNLCNRALDLIGNADEAKQKLVASFTKIHRKLMKYGHSHVIPLIISTNLINSALGITTEDNENELLICLRYKNTESIKVILQENANRLPQHKLNISQQNNNGNTALMLAIEQDNLECVEMLLKQHTKEDIDKALILAAQYGYTEYVKLFLEKNADVNIQNKEGYTALMSAAKNGHLEAIEILLKQNANINLKNKDRSTALTLATTKGHAETVEMLLNHGANINLTVKDRWTALMLAAKKGHLQCLEILLKYKADVNYAARYRLTALMVAAQYGNSECVKKLLAYKANIKHKNMHGETALIIAAEYGNLECLKILLENNADINVQSKYCDTALILASENNHKECVKMLLENNADINIQNVVDNTALMLVTKNGSIECLKILLEQNVNINLMNRDKSSALMLAILSSHLKCVEILLEKNADVNLTDGYYTALMYATEEGDLECMKMLLEKNVNIDYADKYGKTALMLAIKSNHLEAIEMLLDKNADVNLSKKNGETALMLAIKKNNLKCVELLLKKNANIHLKTNYGYTALKLAIEKGHLECVEMLLKYDIKRNNNENSILAAQNSNTKCVKRLLEQNTDINMQNKKGYTALMEAANQGNLSCLKILLEKNADIKQQDKNGHTALIYAAKKGNLACLKMLLEKNADIKHQDKNGNTVLMFAAKNNKTECLKMLLEKNADINIQSKNGDTALMLASKHNYFKCVEIMLKYGADVNLTVNFNNNCYNLGYTALMFAARNNSSDCVEILLEYNADSKHQDKNGLTALMLASIYGHPECIEILLEYNADVNIQDKNGVTALMFAAKGYYLLSLELLLEKNTDIKHQDKNGLTVLMYSAIENHEKGTAKVIIKNDTDINMLDNSTIENYKKRAVEIILKNGADINMQDNNGFTALMHAALKNQPQFVKNLLTHKADVNLTNNNGETALDIAKRKKHEKCITYLEHHSYK